MGDRQGKVQCNRQAAWKGLSGSALSFRLICTFKINALGFHLTTSHCEGAVQWNLLHLDAVNCDYCQTPCAFVRRLIFLVCFPILFSKAGTCNQTWSLLMWSVSLVNVLCGPLCLSSQAGLAGRLTGPPGIFEGSGDLNLMLVVHALNC